MKPIIASLVFSLFFHSVNAQVKIGIINAQDVFAKTKAGMKIQEQLGQLQKKKEQEIQQLQEEINRLQKDLQSPALSDQDRESKKNQLNTKSTQLKRSVEDAQREFERESAKSLQNLENKLIPLINEYGKQNGFTAIFDLSRPGIIYFDNSIDISNDIIILVDNKYPD